MALPAAVGSIVIANSNALIGFPLSICRLAVLAWAAKSADELEPGVLGLPVEDPLRRAAELKIVEDFLGQTPALSWPTISPIVNPATLAARDWTPPGRDPLILDLDGAGITTSEIDPNHPIIFDMNGDGTLTATGWIASGEAIVVRDLNGNGLIDSGRELFGDSTVLTHAARMGQLATNGVAEVTGSLLLANNNFYREFTDDPTPTTEVQALPQMQGSGLVRGCTWSRQSDSGMAVHLAHAIKNGASCAGSIRAKGRFEQKRIVLLISTGPSTYGKCACSERMEPNQPIYLRSRIATAPNWQTGGGE